MLTEGTHTAQTLGAEKPTKHWHPFQMLSQVPPRLSDVISRVRGMGMGVG